MDFLLDLVFLVAEKRNWKFEIGGRKKKDAGLKPGPYGGPKNKKAGKDAGATTWA
jgi:hypothetical protein